MAIEFSCTHCGKPLWAGDGSSGQRVLCASCGNFSIVPDKPAAPETPWPGPPDPTSGGLARLAEDVENPYSAPLEMEWTTYRPPGAADSRGPIALVLGVVSLGMHLFCCGLGLPFAIAGLVVGIPAMKTENRGLAIAGVVCSSISILAFVAVVVIGLLFFMAAGVSEMKP